MQEFKGLLPSIKSGNTFGYTTSDFNLSDLKILLNQPIAPRQYQGFVTPYYNAVLKGDKEAIALFEKGLRVKTFRYLKSLINTLCIEKAKVIAWLNKKNRSEDIHNDRWYISGGYNEWKYYDIHKGELDTIALHINLKDGKFSILLKADDSDGYGGYKYSKVLSENISFKSIINQINYFTKRFKNGAY